MGDISTLLRAWSDGDQSALERLTPVVYDELHRLAQRYMKRERPGHSLQTTALVNEAYMRLVGYERMQWQNRAHFFAVSAQLMRRILVEQARRHNLKRGGDVQHVSLEEAAVVGGGQDGCLFQGDMLHVTSAFQVMSPRLLYQDAPHQLSRDGEKVRAILPLHSFITHQAHVCLIHQGR